MTAVPQFLASWPSKFAVGNLSTWNSCPSFGPRTVRTTKRPAIYLPCGGYFTWVQCFSTYVSVLAPAHPETIPELMAYMSTIVRVSQDFVGLAWVRYNAGFRRQAALTRNRSWSQINATLYTLCFTGNAMATT